MDNATVHPVTPEIPADVQFEKQLGTLTAFVRVMRQAGLPIETALQLPIDDPDMRERLVNYWLAGAPEINTPLPATLIVKYEPTPSQIRAREIMGKNFLGIEEAIRHYGAAYTEEQLAALAEIRDEDGHIITEAELEECKNTHLLVAGFPMTILDIRKKAPSKKPKKAFYSYKDAWYNTQAFATDELVGLCWHLIRKTAVDDSFSKAYQNQTPLLGANDYVPRACNLVYAVMLYFMVTGERLFANCYVRTVTLDSDGYRVDVGNFDADGLDVSSLWGGNPVGSFGLSSARKSKK
ncbi:MAG: hypothetical protein KGJ13_05995 [Patescibacteria group bacterium]|nr:hypothetical protein [Patescibacteria group bacterium]